MHCIINFTRCIRNVQYLCFNINSILSTDCVTIHGIEYRAGCYLYIGGERIVSFFWVSERNPCNQGRKILCNTASKIFVILKNTLRTKLELNPGKNLSQHLQKLRHKFVISKKQCNEFLYVQLVSSSKVELDV